MVSLQNTLILVHVICDMFIFHKELLVHLQKAVSGYWCGFRVNEDFVENVVCSDFRPIII